MAHLHNWNRHPKSKRKPNPAKFHWVTGDSNFLNYGGTWGRKISPTAYHFIQLTNMDDACGCDNAEQPTYSIELAEVDLSEISAKRKTSAIDSCMGREAWVKIPSEFRQEALAEALFSYGNKALLDEISTNNAYSGLDQMRKASYSTTRDSDKHEAALSRPVNALGSTAAEFMRGDIQSAIIRGIGDGHQDARIIGKMYTACDGNTLGGHIDISGIRTALAEVENG